MYQIFILIILGVMPGISFADAFSPPANDISMLVLNQIFGGLVNGGNNAFGGGILIFNTAVLSLGGILASYTILAGTLGTAHDGEMLGKKFSSVWLPIRYALGTALVLPVLPGGYCVMSQLVMWCVKFGVGIAGAVWGAYLSSENITANITYPTTAQMQIQKVAEDAFLASVCVSAHVKYISDSPILLKLFERYDWSVIKERNTYLFGDQKGILSFSTKSDCGYVKFPDPVENQTVATGGVTTNTGYLGSLDNLFRVPDLTPINNAHKEQTDMLVKKMQVLGAKVVDNYQVVPKNAPLYYAEIVQASKDYMKAVHSVAEGIVSGSIENHDGNDYGWVLAGAYFNSIIINNNKITSAMNGFPTSSGSTDVVNTTEAEDDATKYMVGTQVLSARGPEYQMDAGAQNAKTRDKSHVKSDTSAMGKFAGAFAEVFTKINLSELKNDPRHPLIIVNEMGNRLLTSFAILTLSVPALAFGVGLIPVVGAAVASGINTAMGFLMLPIAGLIATGFTLAYVIPFLPFMIWIAVVIGWIIKVVIAILASPLWCVMHLHPNGDDLTGKGGNGYTLLLNIVLTPALCVFGFITAIAVSSIGGELINKLFFQVFSFSQGDGNGILGFIGIIAGTAIYAILIFSFIKKCFGFIHVINDEVLRWVGGSESIGSFAKTMESGSHGGFTAIATNIGSAGRIGGTGEKDTAKIKDRNDKIKNNIGAMFSKNNKEDKKQIENGGNKKDGEKNSKDSNGSDSPKSYFDMKKESDGKNNQYGSDVNNGNKPSGENNYSSRSSDEGSVNKESIMNTMKDQSTENGNSGPYNVSDTTEKFSNALSMVDDRNSFMESVNKRCQDNPDVPVSKHIDSAYNGHLNNSFGIGSGIITAKVGDGYHTNSANEMANSYKDIHSKLSDEFGSESAKSMIGEANKSALVDYKNSQSSTNLGGASGLKDFVKQELKTLEDKIPK